LALRYLAPIGSCYGFVFMNLRFHYQGLKNFVIGEEGLEPHRVWYLPEQASLQLIV
jgi:hypothetical protein